MNRRLASLLLVLGGAVFLGAAGLHYFRGYEAQSEGRKDWARMRSASAAPMRPPDENPGISTPTPAVTESTATPGISAPTPEAATEPTPPPYPYGKPVARLRIPSAEIDNIVFGGADQATLEKGPGHVPGSEMPGEDTGRNNCVITAHRDSHFRHLGWLRKGQRIELETTAGRTLDYRVVSREIVTPDAVRVLQATAEPRLTLITCYPFNYVGAAPKRLVVVAEPVSRHPS
jgi:sortase A